MKKKPINQKRRQTLLVLGLALLLSLPVILAKFLPKK